MWLLEEEILLVVIIDKNYNAHIYIDIDKTEN